LVRYRDEVPRVLAALRDDLVDFTVVVTRDKNAGDCTAPTSPCFGSFSPGVNSSIESVHDCKMGRRAVRALARAPLVGLDTAARTPLTLELRGYATPATTTPPRSRSVELTSASAID